MRPTFLKYVLFFVSAFAIVVANATDVTTTKILASLKTNLPELKINAIDTTAIPGIYEVISGRKVFYVDSSGRYAFLGNLVDLTTKQSLTEAKIQQLSVIKWGQLPLKIALIRVIGDGSRKLAVFTDPDCPFCQRLEQNTISNLKNVTVYYFLYPLAIHADAESDAKRILCAENPDKTFLAWMIDGKVLPKKTTCSDAAKLTIMQNVGNKIVGVTATPTLILPNGSIISGLVPADYLTQLLVEASPTINESKAH